jgi:pimeloyl-ACP methyl ester carboxylesterase
MEFFTAIGNWITQSESLLSGAAALIVLLGVLASAARYVYRRVTGARNSGSPEKVLTPEAAITLRSLSAPAPYAIQFAESDGLRIAYAVIGNGRHDIVMAPGIISHLNIMSHLPPIRDTLEAWGSGVLRDIFFPSISRERMDDKTYQGFERLIATRQSIRQLVDYMKKTDVRPLLPHITSPVLVIHFAGDLAIPIRLGRALAAALPNAQFLEVVGIDHADLSQSPEAIAVIRQFTDSL